jgi:hypothetical protein
MGMSGLEIKKRISASTLSRRAGVYTARWGFFYRHGQTSQLHAETVREKLPGACVLDHGEVWKSFRGGASVAQSSHWWVKFTIAKL